MNNERLPVGDAKYRRHDEGALPVRHAHHHHVRAGETPANWPVHQKLASLESSSFLSFARVDHRVSVWLADNRGMRFHIAESDFVATAGLACEFTELLRHPESRSSEFERTGQRLSASMLSSVQGMLEPSRTICVHLAGGFPTIPVGALRLASGLLFSESYEYAHAYDFPLRKRDVSRAETGAERPFVLVDDGTPRQNTGGNWGGAISDVAFTLAAYPNHTVIKASDVEHDRRCEFASAAEVIHLRSTAEDSSVLKSLLALSAGAPLNAASSPNDGDQSEGAPSSSGEPLGRCQLLIADLDYRCSGDRDVVSTASEIVRRMHAAGARYVIAPLWNVERAARLAYLEALYAALRRGIPAPQAARRASLELRTLRRWSHPHYWAGYICSVRHC